MKYKDIYSHREPSDIEEYLAEKLDKMHERYEDAWSAINTIMDSNQSKVHLNSLAIELKILISHLRHGTIASKDELHDMILKLVKGYDK
ncbi:MAG: hypothetical protein ACO39F_04300 [Candidatus Nanopelagicaceae bacterium]